MQYTSNLLRRHLHNDIFMQKQRDLFLFYPFVYTNVMKMHLKTGTSKNKDLSGDLENRARKNAWKCLCKQKNEYLVNMEAISSWLSVVTYFLLGLAFLVCLAFGGKSVTVSVRVNAFSSSVLWLTSLCAHDHVIVPRVMIITFL